MLGRITYIAIFWAVIALFNVLLAGCIILPNQGENTRTPAQDTATNEPGPPVRDDPSLAPTDSEPPSISTPTPFTPPEQTATDDTLPITTIIPTEPPIRFAVIGDYGSGNKNAEAVANLVKSWNPDFIITTGDNNYPDGEWETIDKNIGQFYIDFIKTDESQYGPGAETNRFFPSLGNHDWNTQDRDSLGPCPYLRYFHNLPGNGRYYDFVWGPVRFFAVDADSREPDGVSKHSTQATWLKDGLAASTSPWKVVFMHQPPYSSGYHGSVTWMQWPFEEWGASVVLSGHDHTYERILRDGFPYLVNGLGGGARYSFSTIVEGSQVRFRDDWGAMLVGATDETMLFHFITVAGKIIDTFRLGFGTYDPLDGQILNVDIFLPLLLRPSDYEE